MTLSQQADGKPLTFREWRLGGAALGTHDPAPAKPCAGASRYSRGQTKRQTSPLAVFGVVDWGGLYLLAGLSDVQAKVAELHYERGLESFEIALFLNWHDEAGNFDARRASNHLYKATEKLRRLGQAIETGSK